jgi:hypothetical protein
MSDLTTHAKLTMEGFIRYDRPATILGLGIITIVSFAFMKAAVLDYGAEESRRPYISSATCAAFRRSLTSGSHGPVLPDGLQVWIARYRGKHKMEGRAAIDNLEIDMGVFRGYGILIITYAIGALAFQLTCPRWLKTTRRRPPLPMITQNEWVWGSRSTLIWPAVDAALWPPPKHLDSTTLEDFRERFKTLNVQLGRAQ